MLLLNGKSHAILCILGTSSVIIPGCEIFTLHIPGMSSFRVRKLPFFFPLEKGMFPLAEPLLYVCNKTLQGAVTNCLIITTPSSE